VSIGDEWLPSWTENRPQRHDLATQRRQEATDDHMRDSDAPLPRKLLKLIIEWKRSGAFVDSLQWALGRQDAENSSFWPVPARCGFLGAWQRPWLGRARDPMARHQNVIDAMQTDGAAQ
jgi:hypothetical protein